MESIELVAEAMATSRKNIESFVDGLRTTEEQSILLASSMGVTLATSVDELAKLFNQLAYDADGLTDAENDLLNTNLELLKNTDAMEAELDVLNAALNETASGISTLDGVLKSLESVIDKLRGAAIGSSYTLDMFYKSMAETQRLAETDDFESFSKSLSKTIGYSSVLQNEDAFALTRDMEFAQLVAANQFEALQIDTQTEIDFLEEIANNTEAQIAITAELMSTLGADINKALLEMIPKTAGGLGTKDPIEEIIKKAYESVLGREADIAGLDYWTSDVKSGGSVTTSNIGTALGAAAVENTEMSREDYIAQLYTQGLGRTATSAEIDYWANQSATPTTELASLFDQIDPNFQSFAVGTPSVPYDMMANIHQGEMIVPKTFNEGVQSGSISIGNNDALVAELRIQNAKLNDIITVLRDTRDISNSSLVSLQTIEAVS